MPQAKQPTRREHNPTQQQSFWAHSFLLNTPFDTVLPTRGTRLISTHEWAGTSLSQQEACASFLDEPHSPGGQRAEARKKYNLAACRMETAITKKLHKMRCQKNMSQTKEQDKTPEEQLSKVEIGKLPQKSIQNNNSKDDPRSQKKNGGTHWKDSRNV